MTDSKQTQCPHCQAKFKVTNEQLSMAGGKVRCGACMNIFDALSNTPEALETQKTITEKTPNYASFLDTSDDPIDLESEMGTEMEEAISEAEKALAEEANVKAAPAHSPSAAPEPEEEEELLFEDNPEEDELDAKYRGAKTMSDEFSTDFLNLDKDEALLGDDPFKTGIKEPEEVEVDESWTDEILDKKQLNDDLDAVSKEGHEEDLSKGLFAERDDQYHAHFENAPPPKQKTNEAIDELAESIENQEFSYNNLRIPTIEEETPRKRRPWVTAAFAITNITLLVALLAQASWFHYDKLAHIEELKPLYVKACGVLKCTLPTLSDVSAIRSQNLVVRSHPTLKDSLIIDAIIINDARYSQPFPKIGIYFSDINDNVVAQRLIQPNEYLAGELLSWKAMPVQRQIHIALEIIDPGNHAVNYSIKFFETEAS